MYEIYESLNIHGSTWLKSPNGNMGSHSTVNTNATKIDKP